MTDRFKEAARTICGVCTCSPDYTSRKKTDPQCAWCDIGEETTQALRAQWNAGLQRAVTIADETKRDALEGEKQDREFLGRKYDMNSYGTGHNAGEAIAAERIAGLVRMAKEGL